MSNNQIQSSIQNVINYFIEHPDEACGTGKPTTAIIEEGLRCRAEREGTPPVITDMPQALGGGGTAVTPGGLLQAALATCDATVIAMRAAQEGVTLTRLEVMVNSEWDDRGLLGMDDSVPPGPLKMWTQVRIAADDVPLERLREIVEWAETHSPVADAIDRAVSKTTEIEIV